MKSIFYHRNLLCTTTLAALAIFTQPLPAYAQQQAYEFNIPAQDLDPALRAFADATRLQLIFDGADVRGKRSNTLTGRHTADAALDRLIADSGLRVERRDSGVLVLSAGSIAGEFGAGQGPAGSASGEWESEEIVVTGSHIRGVNTTVGSQLITIDREQIDRQSYATVRDVLEDLPQNFGGGATGERQRNTASENNISFGSSVNLRGLGNTATLALINGRRIPTGGLNADVPDISGIPLAAIERIEILPDGASAVYGSDAVAGVINFILKKNYNGLESRARIGTATGTQYSEYQISQSGGVAWGSGNLFVSYEFNHSDRFGRKERSFTESMDFRPYGGLDRRFAIGNPSNILDPHTRKPIYAVPQNQDGRSLEPGMLLGPGQLNYVDYPAYQDTYPRQRRHSIYGYANQELAKSISVFAEARYTYRGFNNQAGVGAEYLLVDPSNPFYVDVYGDNSPVLVAYSFENELPPRIDDGWSENMSTTLGLDWEHSANWATNAYLAYSQERVRNISGPVVDANHLRAALSNPNPEQAFNPFGHGRINSHELINSLVYDVSAASKAQSYQANFVTSGGLFDLLGSTVKVAIGAEYRRDKFNRSVVTPASNNSAFARREAASLFGELFVPLVSPQKSVSWARRLELSLSTRYERIEDSGGIKKISDRNPQHSANPRVGVLYTPVDGIVLRGSYGTSFRAPALSSLIQAASVSANPTSNPRNPNQQIYGIYITGARRDLKNETADTRSVGIELTPAITRSVNIKISYFDVVFKDQVGPPARNIDEAILDSTFSQFVNLSPTLADVQAACALAPEGYLFISPGDCEVPGRIQFIYDARETNIARTKVKGMDLDVRIPIHAGRIGRFVVQGLATYLIDYKLAATSKAFYSEKVNTAGRPLTFKAKSSVIWESPLGIVANADVNYAGKYEDDIQNRKISSWTTFDLGVSYTFYEGKSRHILSDTSARFTVNNIFNNTPPFYEDPALLVAYDAANADPFGRRVSLSIVKKW